MNAISHFNYFEERIAYHFEKIQSDRKKNLISCLPLEMLCEIFTHLLLQDLGRLPLVFRKWSHALMHMQFCAHQNIDLWYINFQHSLKNLSIPANIFQKFLPYPLTANQFCCAWIKSVQAKRLDVIKMLSHQSTL